MLSTLKLSKGVTSILEKEFSKIGGLSSFILLYGR
jgi:hypothetical protein